MLSRLLDKLKCHLGFHDWSGPRSSPMGTFRDFRACRRCYIVRMEG